MSIGELACTYASLVLHDDGIAITAEKISELLKASNLTVESYWPSLFAKLCEKRSVEDLIVNIGSGGAVAVSAPTGGASGGAAAAAEAAPAAEAKVEEKEESDEDMGMGLFD
ncbi:60S acidic ribosomal protein family [Perilla frutescens var. hirtella]|uniref:60S acidic ribosomal protein family n=1 Tax=Perilla frutescens var. hirtella TaxID=608512 RepID=A0AAD4IPC0_PERFH|nr:60S acidic ribosomal protein family [Perilla frutescens var. hirtella]KAH6766878.1 60S acidic ribosomal protein family [Perilla frutescens var. hirtella]KAH6811622.1 60S acidic ribosomal protein family [Perilla frutescens var. frutescens]